MLNTRRLAMGLALVGLTAGGVRAQDPVTLYPENYRVLLENDRVRVLDFTLRRGATEAMHRHPAHVLYVLTGFKVRFTLADGSSRVRETKAGDVLFSEAVMHSPLNIGETDAHGLLVEMKDLAAGKLTALTFIHGRAGQGEELKRALLELTAPTRAEPGAIAYDLYQSADRENEFVRYEVWQDGMALDAHKASPHLQASFERRKREGWTTEITLWKRVGE